MCSPQSIGSLMVRDLDDFLGGTLESRLGGNLLYKCFFWTNISEGKGRVSVSSQNYYFLFFFKLCSFTHKLTSVLISTSLDCIWLSHKHLLIFSRHCFTLVGCFALAGCFAVVPKLLLHVYIFATPSCFATAANFADCCQKVSVSSTQYTWLRIYTQARC